MALSKPQPVRENASCGFVGWTPPRIVYRAWWAMPTLRIKRASALCKAPGCYQQDRESLTVWAVCMFAWLDLIPSRELGLLLNTLQLAAAVCAISVPLGGLLAIVLA